MEKIHITIFGGIIMTIKERFVVKTYKAFCHYLNKNHIPHIVTIMVDGRIKGHAGSSDEQELLKIVSSIIRKTVIR